jgi:hypothetical protein
MQEQRQRQNGFGAQVDIRPTHDEPGDFRTERHHALDDRGNPRRGPAIAEQDILRLAECDQSLIESADRLPVYRLAEALNGNRLDDRKRVLQAVPQLLVKQTLICLRLVPGQRRIRAVRDGANKCDFRLGPDTPRICMDGHQPDELILSQERDVDLGRRARFVVGIGRPERSNIAVRAAG